MEKYIEIGGRLHSTATGNVVTGANEILDDELNKKQSQINSETLQHVESIDAALQELSPDQTQALALATDVVNLKKDVDQGAVFDVSAKYPTSGVDGGNTYTLEGALAVLNANLPANKKKGGMSIKFVQSSDNKYVQYFLNKDEWSVNEADWEKMNLEEEVSQLGQEVNDLEGDYDKIVNRTPTSNLFDSSKVTEGYYWWIFGPAANGNLFYSDKIPVTPGETYTIQFDSNVRVIGTMRMIVGYKSDGTLATNGAFENISSYTAPSDCAYIIFTEEIAHITRDFAFVKAIEVIPYEKYGNKVELKDGIVKNKNIDDSCISVDKLADDIITTGNNLFDKDTILEGHYIKYSDGTTASGTGWWCSSFIELKPNTVYSINAMRDYAFYDEDKQYISGDYQTQTNYTFTTGAKVHYLRFSGYTGMIPSGIMLNKGNSVLPYEPYVRYISPELLPPTNDEMVDICLPDKIYAVVGDTLQIFVRSIIRAIDPYIYDVFIGCSVGQRFPRYYQLVATSTGTYTLSVVVKDNKGNVLGAKTCQIIVKETVSQPSSEKKVLFIGDSLTAHGVYTQEAYRRLCGSGGIPAGLGYSNISFVGRKKYGDIHAEGNSGWSWADYLTSGRRALTFTVSAVSTMPEVGAVYKDSNDKEYTMWWDYSTTSLKFFAGTNTPPSSGTLTKVSGVGDSTITYSAFVESSANPFWNDSTQQLDITSYVNKWCGRVDVVYTLLSWNGVSGNQTDFTNFINYATALYRAIHTAYPDVVIKMMAVQLPDLRQGEKIIGAPTQNRYTDMNGLVRTAFNMNDAYQEFANQVEFSPYVEFVNIASQFDSEYNMPYTEVAVNSRNSSVTDKVGTNDVHPSTNGYYQIADVVFRNFVANFCQ